MNVGVSGPAGITRVACFQGTFGSTTPCGQAQITRKGDAVFSQSNLPAFQAMSVVTAMPPGTVESTAPILDERWSLDKAFSRTPVTVGGGMGLLVLVVGGLGFVMWRRGRDVRFKGSQVDQVMGGAADAETQPVPLFEKNVDVVEFAPPEDLRPGQVGTLIDEEANTLDVSATIVDLAVRKYLVDRGDPEDLGCSARPTGTCAGCPTRRATTCCRTSRSCATGCSRTGTRSSCRSCGRRSPSACRR